jgi:hypothetical protein
MLTILINTCSTFSAGGRYDHLQIAAGGSAESLTAPKIAGEAIEQSALADDQEIFSRVPTPVSLVLFAPGCWLRS